MTQITPTPGPRRDWQNYILIRAVRAMDLPNYYILSYLVAKPDRGAAMPLDRAGFEDEKGPFRLVRIQQCYLSLN